MRKISLSCLIFLIVILGVHTQHTVVETRLLAMLGDAESQYSLGWMYQFGKDVPSDYKKAIEWYSKAAENGDASAQYGLGWMYQFGKGVQSDYKKAVEWYSKAAEQGVADAQKNLSEMYEFGVGVPQDYVLSYMWFNLRVANGDDSAIKARGDLSTKMTPEQITKAQQMSSDWFAKHPQE